MCALVGGLLVGAAALAICAFSTGTRDAGAARKDAPKAEPAPKVEPPKPAPAPKVQPQPAPTPVVSAPTDKFAEALKAAEVLSAKADAAEPEETRKALALLTQRELFESGAALIANGQLTEVPPDSRIDVYAPKLKAVGLSSWVDKHGRKLARKDPEFLPVSRALWNPASGPEGLFAMMGTWGMMNPFIRPMVVRAVEAGARADQMPPEVRDAILTLGGREWLQR